MRQRHNVFSVREAKCNVPPIIAGLVAMVLLGATANAQSSDAIVKVIPEETATAAWMLTAPHIGKKICEVPASTPIRFIAHARHGPHRFARVEVLEGDCAGRQGYVPWSTLEPKPK